MCAPRFAEHIIGQRLMRFVIPFGRCPAREMLQKFIDDQVQPNDGKRYCDGQNHAFINVWSVVETRAPDVSNTESIITVAQLKVVTASFNVMVMVSSIDSAVANVAHILYVTFGNQSKPVIENRPTPVVVESNTVNLPVAKFSA